MIEVSESGNYVLDTPVIEELEGYPLTLFEGENYIYTNYENAQIEIIYPKDNAFNKMYLSNAIYCGHSLNSMDDFSLEDIYFKDAFTKTENKLNLEVNNATIDCLSSKNNKFSLDEEGNLIVNSLMANSINIQNLFNLIYPVGSFYISENETNPSILFGGVWTQVKDTFLLGSGDKHSAGTTGGEEEHKLTIDEMPNHNHKITIHKNTGSGSMTAQSNGVGGSVEGAWWVIGKNGGDKPHNNMPPYLTVYIWKRVS